MLGRRLRGGRGAHLVEHVTLDLHLPEAVRHVLDQDCERPADVAERVVVSEIARCAVRDGRALDAGHLLRAHVPRRPGEESGGRDAARRVVEVVIDVDLDRRDGGVQFIENPAVSLGGGRGAGRV